MQTLGVSFSLHRCSELSIDKKDALESAIKELGFARFRLMSYWNIHEQKQGEYNFSELDWQLDMIAGYGGTVTLCLGKRQPRWPECHMPEWARELSKQDWYEALYKYIKEVVLRYKDHPALASWQLENEALLKEFGYCTDQDYSRKRLKAEYAMVKELDSSHPVIMSLSDSWGLPIRSPRPDKYAMSLYKITITKQGQHVYSSRPAFFYRARRWLIALTRFRATFIHELQAEPWLSKALTEVPVNEQLRYMNAELFSEICSVAQKTGSNPIDLWGLEWWYWLRTVHNKPELWNTVQATVAAHGLQQ